jgi:hypothetical protein
MMLKRAHISAGSRSTYFTAERELIRFMARFHPTVPALPVSDEHLEEFLAHKSETCSYDTLRNYIYGLRYAHLERSLPFAPLSERVGPKLVMEGIKRVKGSTPKPKRAITIDDMRAIAKQIAARATTSPVNSVQLANDLSVFAAMLVGFFGMLRKDTLTATKLNASDSRQGLRRGDIQLVSTGSSCVAYLHLRQTKTIQHQQRVHVVPLFPTGDEICPVSALVGVLERTPGSANSHAFRWLNASGGSVNLTHARFVAHMKQLLADIGVPTNDYAGHSLRRGGATFSLNLGFPENEVKRLGTWTSNTVHRYHEVSDAARDMLPARMAAAAARRL